VAKGNVQIGRAFQQQRTRLELVEPSLQIKRQPSLRKAPKTTQEAWISKESIRPARGVFVGAAPDNMADPADDAELAVSIEHIIEVVAGQVCECYGGGWQDGLPGDAIKPFRFVHFGAVRDADLNMDAADKLDDAVRAALEILRQIIRLDRCWITEEPAHAAFGDPSVTDVP
jgi:hypothetical protein